MDAIKQEKYALLHDDSDIEEFNESKAAQMSQNGKSNLRRTSAKSMWAQPQWFCHTVFLVVLISSQTALGIFVLTMHIDMEKVKLEQASLQRNEFGMNAHPHHIDNASSSRLENVTQTKIKSIEKMVFRHGEDLKALQAKQRVEGMKYENTFEQQFNNMTRALNSFQNRLEEPKMPKSPRISQGLDIAFSQISQLRDDIYFMENALNHTKKERLGEIVTTLEPAMGGMRTRVTTPFPASQTVQIMQEDDTTTQQVSKQKEMSKERYRISLSFLKSRTDFQVFFYGADKDANGYLTYAEIRKVLGEEAPGEDALLQFDEDQNRMYSYNELIRTFQLND